MGTFVFTVFGREDTLPKEMGRIIIGTGARGDLVRRVQTQLIPFGFRDSDVDGIFGSITQQAVLRYQRAAAEALGAPRLPEQGTPQDRHDRRGES